MGQKEEQLPESIGLYVNRSQLRSELSDANTCYVIAHGVFITKQTACTAMLALVWPKPGPVGHFYPGISMYPPPPYLHQAVSNQTHQQLLPIPLSDQRGVLSAVHAGEVKHGHVGLAGGVLHELEVRQFPTCGEVGCIVGVEAQSLMVHVGRRQQLLGVAGVLRRQREAVSRHVDMMSHPPDALLSPV